MKTKIPQNLFILEMANNHMGDVSHGIKLIKDFGSICKKYPFNFVGLSKKLLFWIKETTTKIIEIMPIITLIWSSLVYLKVKVPNKIPTIDAGIIIFKIWLIHFFQYKYIAEKSIIIKRGSKIPAAWRGLITKDMTGTASIAIGPGTPPLEIPKTNTPKEAKTKKVGSTI